MGATQALCLLLLIAAAGCARPATNSVGSTTTLRIAISAGRMSLSAPDAGLMQVRQNLAVESLAAFDDDGTPRPSVAEGWTVSPDRRVVTIRLRPNLKYQDGSSVTADDIVTILRRSLPRSMGVSFEDIEEVHAASPQTVEIRFRRPSGFRLELLEITVLKPGAPTVGTGPYVPLPNNKNQLRANENYYLGKPLIQHITIESYPTFRAAWADMLRGQNDMLYEVGADALESLRNAKGTARVFTFPKRYQYVIVLNTRKKPLRTPEVRQAINFAIDRGALIRDALDGRGEPSTGPVNGRQWAIAGKPYSQLSYDPRRAAALIADVVEPVRFKCLVLADQERLALVVKRQLQAIGVDMDLEEVTSDQALKRISTGDFDAFLVDVISGPTMYRLYRFWHSSGSLNPGRIGTPRLDAALDEVRHSGSDDEYRAGVLDVQKAIVEDPPAIFLAWSEGARAVSSRFDVPEDSSRPDPIGTLRLWKPANVTAPASRN